MLTLNPEAITAETFHVQPGAAFDLVVESGGNSCYTCELTDDDRTCHYTCSSLPPGLTCFPSCDCETQ